MNIAVADTHVLIWYLSDSPKLSSKALEKFETALNAGGHICISSITLVEIVYLVEKDRISVDASNQLSKVLDNPDTYLKIIDLNRNIAESVKLISRDAVPDMPDRIIAATASFLNLPLITRDHKIRAANLKTIW